MPQAYADYHDMMELTEKLVSGAAAEILGTTTIVGGDGDGAPPDVDLKAPWRRVTMNDLVKEKTGTPQHSTAQHTTITSVYGGALNILYKSSENVIVSKISKKIAFLSTRQQKVFFLTGGFGAARF